MWGPCLALLGIWLTVPTEARAEGGRCSPAVRARSSTLILRRGGRLVGSGFLFRDRRTVATAEHVAEAGVDGAEDLAGNHYRLSEVSVDQKRDLAIMRLDRAVPAEPLQPATEVSLGMEVFAIGHPRVILGSTYEPLTRWSIASGRVTGVDDDWVASDAAVYPGNSGGPLVDCAGRVVAVASHGPDDLRIFFAGRSSHLDALRGGAPGPRYRVPIEPVSSIELGATLGHDQLGAMAGVTWRSERGWLARFSGSASSNGLTGDIFATGLRRRVRASLVGGVALRPFRGWRYASLHVEPSLGFALERDLRRQAVVDGAGGITSRSSNELSALGVAAIRLQLGRWFIEPRASISLAADPHVDWFVTIGYSFSL